MQTKSIPLSFDKSEAAEEMAKPLIANYHTHLVNCRIAYLYRNKPMNEGGRTVFAKAKKCSTEVKSLCEASGGEAYDFYIIINYEVWNTLSDTQQRAVLDHELCHCWVEDDEKTGEPKYKILPHGLSEFSEILDRYGPEVFDDLKRFCELAREKLDKAEEPVVILKKEEE